MEDMGKLIILSFFYVLVGVQFTVYGDNVADSWTVFRKEAKHIWNNCSNKQVKLKLNCVKQGSLQLLDSVAAQNMIPLTKDMRLVVRQQENNDQEKQLILSKQTSKLKACDYDKSNGTWSERVLQKIVKTFDSHILQIDFSPPEKLEETARHRRRNQMLPMMTFGVVAFGMFFVPLGFQFLAVLGGKAFLMAKMALLLASVNGLKRVATSGVHYGLYHPAPELPYPVPHQHLGGYHGGHHAFSAWHDRDGGIGPRLNRAV